MSIRPERTTEITGWAARSTFCTIGVSMSRGRLLVMPATLSRTSWVATSPFLFRLKTTTTLERLVELVDLI